MSEGGVSPGTAGAQAANSAIDVHAHCIPGPVDELLIGEYGKDLLLRPQLVPGDTPVGDSEEDLQRRLRLMDDAGVAVQILSLPPPPVLQDEGKALELARLVNDGLAAVVARHPDRLAACAHLPLPHVEAAQLELERVSDELGMKAVCVGCSFDGVSAVADALDPVYAELDRREMVVFFHPAVTGLCSSLVTDFRLQGALGTLLEDSVLVAQLVLRQFPERFPRMRMIVPHLGGITPIYLERMDNQVSRLMAGSSRRPSVVARQLWYDTVSHGSGVALRAACESLGWNRIVAGSDFPALEYFTSYSDCINYVRTAGVPEEAVEAILRENAAELFRLPDPGWSPSS